MQYQPCERILQASSNLVFREGNWKGITSGDEPENGPRRGTIAAPGTDRGGFRCYETSAPKRL